MLPPRCVRHDQHCRKSPVNKKKHVGRPVRDVRVGGGGVVVRHRTVSAPARPRVDVSSPKFDKRGVEAKARTFWNASALYNECGLDRLKGSSTARPSSDEIELLLRTVHLNPQQDMLGRPSP